MIRVVELVKDSYVSSKPSWVVRDCYTISVLNFYWAKISLSMMMGRRTIVLIVKDHQLFLFTVEIGYLRGGFPLSTV